MQSLKVVVLVTASLLLFDSLISAEMTGMSLQERMMQSDIVVVGGILKVGKSPEKTDAAETLVMRMTDKSVSWEDRCAAEDELANMQAREVLSELLPHVSRGMPDGAIWNSGGREIDKRAPIEWQIFYAVARSWDHQVNKLPVDGDGGILLEMLDKASAPNAKVRILRDLTLRWVPSAEPIVATLLKNANEDLTVRTTAGLALILQGKADYHDLLLKYADESNHADRKRWYDLLSEPRHKKKTGVDPRVVLLGFSLIQRERELSGDYVHGAYFLAITVGGYIGYDFRPDQDDARYQGKNGLNDQFFEDTVRNSLAWWDENRDKIRDLQIRQDAKFTIGSIKTESTIGFPEEYKQGQTIEILTLSPSEDIGGDTITESIIKDHTVRYNTFYLDKRLQIPKDKFIMVQGTVSPHPRIKEANMQIISWKEAPSSVDIDINKAKQDIRIFLHENEMLIIKTLKQNFDIPEDYPFASLFSNEMGIIGLDLESKRAAFRIDGADIFIQPYVQYAQIEIMYNLIDKKPEEVYLNYGFLLVGP